MFLYLHNSGCFLSLAKGTPSTVNDAVTGASYSDGEPTLARRRPAAHVSQFLLRAKPSSCTDTCSRRGWTFSHSTVEHEGISLGTKYLVVEVERTELKMDQRKDLKNKSLSCSILGPVFVTNITMAYSCSSPVN